MKKLVSLLLVLLLVFTTAACGSSGAPGSTPPPSTSSDSATEGTSPTVSGERLKVGFSLPSMTFPFYVRMYDQITAEAEKRNWDVTFVDGNLDANTQMSGLQDMINNDIDVMIVATWFIDALADIFQQCEQKGIPVFIMDNMVIPAGCETAITFTTGTDNYNAGVIGGTWYAGELAAKGITSINMVTVSSQQEQPVRRCTGFMDGLKENGITVNLLNTYDGGKRETAMAVSEDSLTAFSNLELIYGGSAQDSLGAYDATKGANRGNVQVVGFDGEDEELALIDAKTNYAGTITQDPKGQAALLAQNLDKYLAGEKIEQKQETPAGVYAPTGQLSGADILKK